MISKLISKILEKISKKLVSKYALISVLSYCYVFSALYLLVDTFECNKSVSFVLVYGLAYIVLYAVQLKYLFYKEHDRSKFIRYVLAIILFYILANLLYNFGLYFKINYLISTIITIAILMPLRLLVYTFYVYKD